MAAVIGDLVADVSRLRDLITNPRQRSRSQTLDASSPRRSASRLWPAPATPPRSSLRHDAEARPALSAAARGDSQEDDNSSRPHHLHRASSALAPRTAPRTGPSGGGTSRIPSPPSSRSPSAVATGPRSTDDDQGVQSMASKTQGGSQPLAPPDTASMSGSRQQQQPSPPADDVEMTGSHTSSEAPAIPSPTHTLAPPIGHSPGQQVVVHVRDLSHVQTLASTQGLDGAAAGRTKYEISGMPMDDVIEMVAALLTKIIATNDLQHDATQRSASHGSPMMACGGSPISHSVFAFHGKNVPAISICSYLSRIHKYCPTTFEVFLSLLVYFDRMTERVNDAIMKCGKAGRQSRAASEPSQDGTPRKDTPMGGEGRDETDLDIADDDDDDDDDEEEDQDEDEGEIVGRADNHDDGERIVVPDVHPSSSRPVTYFVVDSFNIHRLIIAGVTCASKFFSDVFYTNSRYAKVGGLPLGELNHLEIQFLILNDFRLAVPVEDLEAYATMLVEFYAREVLTARAAPTPGP
ncbi:hypothetical protein L249_3662 [Ophiocordyceps polyrhachis-furcata BCC 54312]|uniref:Cyclin n=1 Tax=Ophiocordyceps polyrhachis-furcata BCC 54312 TaxID=1330021 RepID=A0A367L4T0_9HYPO|nr:hypothetical protein L249_3662 [Ophiocordyceps polyrhachis-furcata BCC 54312]